MRRMDVVFEGPDNTGKSTIIDVLSLRLLHRLIVRSEGPEKYPGEIDKRIGTYYRSYEGVIYDRHPAVSETIYCKLRGSNGPSRNSIDLFYSTKPVIVYCAPVDGRRMLGHTINPGVDTDEHLEQVNRHYDSIVSDYNVWALRRATLIYRIGDDADRLIASILGVLGL